MDWQICRWCNHAGGQDMYMLRKTVRRNQGSGGVDVPCASSAPCLSNTQAHPILLSRLNRHGISVSCAPGLVLSLLSFLPTPFPLFCITPAIRTRFIGHYLPLFSHFLPSSPILQHPPATHQSTPPETLPAPTRSTAPCHDPSMLRASDSCRCRGKYRNTIRKAGFAVLIYPACFDVFYQRQIRYK